MLIHRCICLMLVTIGSAVKCTDGIPHRILLDTDVDTDDIFALLYILKLDRSIFNLQAITITANAWTDIGYSLNELYDLLYMMGRDDVAVGAGGEGGILEDGTILKDVGGYLPIIEQGNGTSGYCRYSQTIPLGAGGKLDIDTKYGYRKSFLPKGMREYIPQHQPTAQEVMIDTISKGPTTVFLIGSQTNFAVFLMSHPELKRNIEHVYVMGGAVRVTGNIFTAQQSSPYAEYNIFADPFAAYQVIHSGIPVTIVPLDATNTAPVTRGFFEEFENDQRTYEAQYCFKILKAIRDTSSDDEFFNTFTMWDAILAGVATSIMLKENNVNGENEFAEMEYMNITLITSNEPYGTNNSSNPLFDGLKTPKFGLKRGDVHSGHVYIRPTDPFCIARNGCKDGYTEQVSGLQGVRVRVAVRAIQSLDKNTSLGAQFYKSFLEVLNRPQQTGRFNLTTQFPHYREVFYKPDFNRTKLGKNVVFDMDMSAGDFIALLYLLKVPVEVINIKAILVTPTGWANAATIDLVYDLLHMMGRDDIPVGLGDSFALGQSYLNFPMIGDCKYNRVIPRGRGGYLDSDTLYGLHRNLPIGPRRYTAVNSTGSGALDIWKSVINSLSSESNNVTILTNGPLTTVAKIILSDKNTTYPIQEIIVVGGHVSESEDDYGNVINVPANKYSEMNMFLDPLAAKTVLDSGYDVTFVPLRVQREIGHYIKLLENFQFEKRKTPEILLAESLVSRLQLLNDTKNYVGTFAGETLGAVVVGGDGSRLMTRYGIPKVQVLATGDECEDGRIVIDEKRGRAVKVLESVDPQAYYTALAHQLAAANQSAVIRSFQDQRKLWNRS